MPNIITLWLKTSSLALFTSCVSSICLNMSASWIVAAATPAGLCIARLLLSKYGLSPGWDYGPQDIPTTPAEPSSIVNTLEWEDIHLNSADTNISDGSLIPLQDNPLTSPDSISTRINTTISIPPCSPFFNAHEDVTLREILTHIQTSISNSLAINNIPLNEPCTIEISINCTSNNAGEIGNVEIKMSRNLPDNPQHRPVPSTSNPVPQFQRIKPDIIRRTQIHTILRAENLERPASSLTPNSRDSRYIGLPKEKGSLHIHKLTFGCSLSDTCESLSIKMSNLNLSDLPHPTTEIANASPSAPLTARNSDYLEPIEFNYKSKSLEDFSTEPSLESKEESLRHVLVRRSVRLETLP